MHMCFSLLLKVTWSEWRDRSIIFLWKLFYLKQRNNKAKKNEMAHIIERYKLYFLLSAIGGNKANLLSYSYRKIKTEKDAYAKCTFEKCGS